MPNRYIRAGIIESEAVNSLGWRTESFYRRLLNRVDDFGRCTAHPSLLLALLFPLHLDRISASDIEQMLVECENVGLLFTYGIEGKRFLVMNKWEQGRAKSSEYPAPPENICQRMQTFVYTPKRMIAHAPDSDSDSDSGSISVAVSAAAAEALQSHSVERPGWDEVREYALGLHCGLAEWKARDWFDEMEACGWLDYNHRPIHDWRAALRRVKTKWESDGRPSQPPSNPRHARAKTGIPESNQTQERLEIPRL